MGIRSSRLKALPSIKDQALKFAIAFHTFIEDTQRYYEEIEKEVQPEVIEPVEIG